MVLVNLWELIEIMENLFYASALVIYTLSYLGFLCQLICMAYFSKSKKEWAIYREKGLLYTPQVT